MKEDNEDANVSWWKNERMSRMFNFGGEPSNFGYQAL